MECNGISQQYNMKKYTFKSLQKANERYAIFPPTPLDLLLWTSTDARNSLMNFSIFFKELGISSEFIVIMIDHYQKENKTLWIWPRYAYRI